MQPKDNDEDYESEAGEEDSSGHSNLKFSKQSNKPVQKKKKQD